MADESNRAFISWSGECSRIVAASLKEFIGLNLAPSVVPWMSDEIPSGDVWFDRILKELGAACFGIVCVSRSNMEAPWLLFEAGALAKRFDERKPVCPYLIDLDPEEIPDKSPLKPFQSKRANHDQTWDLVRDLNYAAGGPLPEEALQKRFESFWPELEQALQEARKARHVDILAPYGIDHVYLGQRAMDERRMWDSVFTDNVTEFDILGHTNRQLEYRKEALLKCLSRRGGRVRILVLDPYAGFHQQLVETARLTDCGADASNLLALLASLQEKVTGTIRFVMGLKKQVDEDKLPGSIDIRLAQSTIYHNITRADNKMWVSHYLSGNREQGQSAPTFVLGNGRHHEGSLFENHKAEFQYLWEEGSHVEAGLTRHASVRQMSGYIEPAIQAHAAWRSDDCRAIPFPVCAIVFPTYRCTLKGSTRRPCSYCPYAGFGDIDMKVNEFEKIVRFLAIDKHGPRVRALELSGGGEPMQHGRFDDLLGILFEVRKERPDLEIGLLTNGIHIDPTRLDSLGVFSYIRANLPEHYYDLGPEDRDWQDYAAGIRQLAGGLGEKTRVGVKLLVSRSNLSSIVEKVRHFYEHVGVKHVKVKPVRARGREIEPRAQDLWNLAGELCALRFEHEFPDLVVDLFSPRVPHGRQCWISPLFTVVDPRGVTYKCCSFSSLEGTGVRHDAIGYDDHRDYEKKWRSDEHLRMLGPLRVRRVCDLPNAPDCRFVEYQRLLEAVFTHWHTDFEPLAGPRML